MDYKFLKPQDQVNMLTERAAYFERDHFNHSINLTAQQSLEPTSNPEEMQAREAAIAQTEAAMATIEAAHTAVTAEIETLSAELPSSDTTES